MTVKVRFFARFRELLGTDIPAEAKDGTTLVSLIRDIAQRKKEGYAAIFDEHGNFHEFVIVMRNGKRIEHGDATAVRIIDGDEIAVFPPVAGG
jgi:sulfur-carrier protein